MAWAASAHRGAMPDVEYHSRGTTTAGKVFGFMSSLGDVAFAYAGHNVVLEIQATIPSTEEKPSKKPMWTGALIAYIVVAFCYFPVAFIGYWAFGNSVEDNVLISLQKPVWIIAMANMFVVVHVIGSYQVKNIKTNKQTNNFHFILKILRKLKNLQVFAMPAFDTLESFMIKKMKFEPSHLLRICTRTTYVRK